MKKVFLIFIAVFSMTALYSQTEVKGISFNETEHDYGTIEQGSNGEYEFVFTNEMDIPLILTNVRSSCGCTVPTYTKEPIETGKTGIIKVKYNTNSIGAFSKSVTIASNAPNSPIVLRIRGNVVSKIN